MKTEIDDMGMEIKTFDDTLSSLSNATDDIFFHIVE